VTILAGSPLEKGFVEGRDARFHSPAGLGYHFDTTTQAHQLLVADKYNYCIRAIDLKSGGLTA
jgi:hypothetical protein